MILSLLSTLVISAASAQQPDPYCDPNEFDVARLSCRCIRNREKSTVYIRGKRLPYTNTIGLCAEGSQPELLWIAVRGEPKCPVIDCHDPSDP